MARKEKLLFLWILVVVVFSFFFSHFWGCTVHALEKAVALNVVSLPSAAKCAAVICAACFLP